MTHLTPKGNHARFGYNAATDVYEDLVKVGVIDATTVVRSALENAASIATLMHTRGAVIAEASRNEKSGDNGNF